MVAATTAAATSETAYTDWETTKLDAWGVQSNIVDDAQQALDLATEYSAKLSAEETAVKILVGTYEGEYNSALSTSEGHAANMATAEENVDNKVAEAAASLIILNSYKASLATQEAEEEAQDAIVALALADVQAQEETVEDLESAAEEASNDNQDAILAEEEATEAKETAQEEYTAAEEAAEGTEEALVTPLEELSGLRATAVERTEELVEALGNESGQELAIAVEQGLVDEASEAYLEAIVECKAARYDEYAAALAGAEETRQNALDTIEELIDDNPVPAAGTIGARCEKAVSNGTFRPKRDEETCTGETVCCGAAKVPVGNLILTIETC